MTAGPRRAVLALDNSGTLSRTDVADLQLVVGEDWERPVPEMNDGQAVALVSIDDDHLSAFETDRSIGEVVADKDVDLYVSLSTVECSTERARAALLEDTTVDARSLVECVDIAIERTEARSDLKRGHASSAAGAQIVVDLDGGRVVRLIGYTSSPVPEAGAVVSRTATAGFEPHLVSGDTASILHRVAQTVGIQDRNVHAYQTPEGKGETVRRLRETTGLPVVMVGDHVHDRFAFEAADLGVFLDHEEVPVARAALAPHADRELDELADLPDVLAEWLATSATTDE